MHVENVKFVSMNHINKKGKRNRVTIKIQRVKREPSENGTQRLNKDIIALRQIKQDADRYSFWTPGARLASVHYLTHRVREFMTNLIRKMRRELRLFRQGCRQAAISSINPWR